ncbi:glycosyltransferase family 2 protein [Flavobacterium piscisymbiosum]|uniref:Glycosyltransferase n=1 Tax=Flavobacterium piscisymbiosum TaxID=2893753 RepID=A0ABS8M8T0_9FLAO|nr:glycosyltransferase family 2 protein [Flavobacterium sp. F-30]MCC9061743.1 glycosyltransferase [Flavobacterium sp. F-30]
MKNVKITIITVVYNGSKDIENTILSIINQQYDNLELIIIDGGSTDGTQEIIKKYSKNIDYWVSEPDNGIYDAMNKGIEAATGEWVNFMNSGDSFYSPEVLSKFSFSSLSNFDVVYGSINCITKSNSFILKPKSVDKILKSMIFCHQAVFTKRRLLINNNFDISLKIAADYKMFFTFFRNNAKFKELDIIVSNYESEDGISSNSFYQMGREYAIVRGNWNNVFVKIKVLLKTNIQTGSNFLRNAVPLNFRIFIRNKIIKK